MLSNTWLTVRNSVIENVGMGGKIIIIIIKKMLNRIQLISVESAEQLPTMLQFAF